MSRRSTNSTHVEKERAQAEALLGSSNESLDRAKQFAVSFEQQVTKLVPQLPSPLQEILRPSLAKLPGDPTHTRMGVTERVQVLVGILNEVDKFNNAVRSEEHRLNSSHRT